MKETFDKVIEELLLSEGGYVDHPKDPGGATNMGITLGTAVANNLDLNKDGKVDKKDVKIMTIPVASRVYRKKYWNTVEGDKLPPGLDYAVFDFAVNSGPERAVIALQRLVGVADDGIMGPRTLIAIAQYGNIDTLINRYQDDRLRFLKALSTFSTFGKGWTARVERVRQTALSLSVSPEKPTLSNPDGGINWAALIPILITLATAILGFFKSRS